MDSTVDEEGQVGNMGSLPLPFLSAVPDSVPDLKVIPHWQRTRVESFPAVSGSSFDTGGK